MTNPAERLVDLLDLERIEVNIFRGRSPEESLQRVFGGQVAGQALVAAGRTTDGDRPVHSLHAYFLRPGRPGVPIVYDVERVRDGRSFTTRRVTAVQQGRWHDKAPPSPEIGKSGAHMDVQGPAVDITRKDPPRSLVPRGNAVPQGSARSHGGNYQR